MKTPEQKIKIEAAAGQWPTVWFGPQGLDARFCWDWAFDTGQAEDGFDQQSGEHGDHKPPPNFLDEGGCGFTSIDFCPG